MTAGGLLFIGATDYDRKFRAFDKATGKLLWETTLPAAGNATPATYEADGRQFVVIAAGGGKWGQPSGGSYVAFALPKQNSALNSSGPSPQIFPSHNPHLHIRRLKVICFDSGGPKHLQKGDHRCHKNGVSIVIKAFGQQSDFPLRKSPMRHGSHKERLSVAAVVRRPPAKPEA